MKNSPIIPYIKALIKKENRMDTESTNGRTVKFIKVNGLTVSKTDQECGEDPKEIHTQENGKTEKLKDMAFTHGLMATGMKDNSKNVLKMEKELKNSQTVTLTKDTTKRANLMAKDNIFGVTAVPTRVNLSKG